MRRRLLFILPMLLLPRIASAATPVDLGEWRLHKAEFNFRDASPTVNCYCDTVPLSLTLFSGPACRRDQAMAVAFEDIQSIRRGDADPDTKAWTVVIRLDDGKTLDGFVAADTALRGVPLKQWTGRGRQAVETYPLSSIEHVDFWTDPNDYTVTADYPALWKTLRDAPAPHEESTVTSPADRLAAADALMKNKDWQSALIQLQGLLRDGHAGPEILDAYRRCVAKTGTAVEAIADVRRWLVDNPGNAAMRMTLAMLLLRAQRYEEAGAESAALLKETGADAAVLREARYIHAESQAKLKHWTDAAAAAADGLEQEDDSRLHAVHGIACLQLGLGDQAQHDFEAALRQPMPDYNYSAVHNNLGGLYELGNRREDALAQYTLAVETDPLNPEALANLQRLRAEMETNPSSEPRK